MASEDYVSISKVENRQWTMLGVFTVLACVAVFCSIYTFSSRISRLEEKTDNLQKTMELYEQKNKELKQENEKYVKSLLAFNTGTSSALVITGDINE